MDANNGVQAAAALKAGLMKGMAEAQFPIIEFGAPTALTPWYQFAFDTPMLALTVATILTMAIVHISTVFVCRRYKAPAQVPLTTLWLSFGVSAGLGMMRVLPQVGIPILVAVSGILVVWFIRDTNTDEH